MVDQKTTYLFDDPALPKELARRTDPPESKKAAKEIAPKLARLQAEVRLIVSRYPDRTANELAQIHDVRDPREIGRRLPELAAQGWIYKHGSRPCTVTGKTAAMWRECLIRREIPPRIEVPLPEGK